MELPIEIQKLINEYAKPLTRHDWIKGSYIHRKIGNRATTLKGHLHGEVLMRAVRIYNHPIASLTQSTVLFYFNDLLFQHGEEDDNDDNYDD